MHLIFMQWMLPCSKQMEQRTNQNWCRCHSCGFCGSEFLLIPLYRFLDGVEQETDFSSDDEYILNGMVHMLREYR